MPHAWRPIRPSEVELVGLKKVWERGVALASTLHWPETGLLAREENFAGLAKAQLGAGR